MDDEQPDHGHGSPASSLVSLPLVDVLGNDDSDDDMAGSHSDRTDGKHGLTANTIDPQHCRNRSDEHDNAHDSRSQKRGCVIAESELLEDLWGVVEDRIDAGPLLEEHGNGRHDYTSEHGLCLEELLDGDELELEDVPGGLFAQLREEFGNAAFLKERLGLDLKKLELDKFMVWGQAAETGEHLSSFRFATVVDQPTWREGHEHHAEEEDEGGGKL